jgi:predicted Zn-dependent peptidase
MVLRSYWWLFCLVLCCSNVVKAQNYFKQNEYFYTLVNGLKIILIEDTTSKNVSIQLSVNVGTSYEPQSIKGGASFIAANLAPNFSKYNTKCILTNDYTGYFSTIQTTDNFEDVLKAFLSAVTTDTFISNANLNTEYIEYNTSFTSCTANKGCEDAVKIIYENNENRLGEPINIFPNDSTYLANTLKFKKSFYCPQNSLVIVSGKFNRDKLFKQLQNTFLDWKDCSYNPNRAFPVSSIKTNDYNIQLTSIVEDSATATLNVYQSGPVMYKNKKEVLAGILFASMVNEETSALRSFFVDSLSIKDIQCDFNFRRFISLFSLKYSIDTANSAFLSMYNKPEFLNYEQFYSTDQLSKAKIKSASIFNNRDSVKTYFQHLTLFNAIASLDYYGKIQDSIKIITAKDIVGFVNKYILKNPFVAVANSPFLNTNTDTLFAETALLPSAYEFKFKKNTGEFEEGNIDSLINSLAQWLKINPSVKVKINGVANADELLTVRDDAMLDYYKNNPGFVIAPSDLIPTKKMRLDVYRSMIIVRKLAEKGISLNQISGTGKVIDNKQAESEYPYRVYCTIRNL